MSRKFSIPFLLGTAVRTFFLQASWNFERMQSLGTLFVLAPGLNRLYRGEALAAAYRRHMSYFNTHPYMAAALLGTVLAIEEEHAAGEKGAFGVLEFKEMVMAPFAAIGDALFWGGVRPLAASIALFFAYKGYLWSPFIFLFLFNLPHLLFRFAGACRGYRSGLRLLEYVQHWRLPDAAIRAKETTVVLLGGLCAYLTVVCLRQESLAPAWGIALLPPVILLGWLTRKGVSNLILILTVAALVLCIGQLV